MTNPQLENGYTRIANEILETVAHYPFIGAQLRMVLFLWRKTYGFHKKADRVSLSQWVEGTGLNQRTVQRQLKRLKEMEVFVTNGDRVRFNKRYCQWGRSVDRRSRCHQKDGLHGKGGRSVDRIQKKLDKRKKERTPPISPPRKMGKRQQHENLNWLKAHFPNEYPEMVALARKSARPIRNLFGWGHKVCLRLSERKAERRHQELTTGYRRDSESSEPSQAGEEIAGIFEGLKGGQDGRPTVADRNRKD